MLPFISFQEEFLVQREPSAYVVSLEDRVEDIAGAPLTTTSSDIPSLAEIRESCRDLFTSVYSSFEAHVKEHLAGTLYVAEKQRAITALKEELYVRAAETTGDARQMYLNYAKVAHLHFSKKAKQLDETIASYAIDAPEPQQYLSRTSEQQHDSHDPQVPYFFAAFGVRPNSHRKKKDRGKERKPCNNHSPGLVSAITAVPVDEAIVGNEDDGSDGLTASGGHLSIPGRIISSDEVRLVCINENMLPKLVVLGASANAGGRGSQTYLSASKVAADFAAEVPTNPGVDPPQIIMPSLSQSVSAPSSPVSSSSSRSSIYSILSIGLGCLAVGLAAATLSLATIAYFNKDSNHVPEEKYASTHVHVAPSSPTPSYAPAEISPALVSVSMQEPYSSTGLYYFPQKAPVNEQGKPQVSADWYQIKSAVQEGNTFTMTVGNEVSLDGRVARFGVDTDGDGKVNKTIYKPLDHQIKITLSESATVMHAGFGVKSPAGMTYLSSVSL